MKEKILRYGVCEGHHDLPVDGYIFLADLNPDLITDPDKLKEWAWKKLRNAISDCEAERRFLMTTDEYDDIYVTAPAAKLDLYVTGLTVALIAVIEAAKELYLPVMLYHYNKSTGEYYTQRIR